MDPSAPLPASPRRLNRSAALPISCWEASMVPAHGFRAAAHCGHNITMNNDLSCGKNGREAAAAKAIDGEGRGLDRQSPFNAATRARYISLASVWITLPKTQARISFAASPERRTDSRVTAAASSVGGMSLSAPPYLPTAVRTALKTTTSRYIISIPLSYSLLVTFTGDALLGAFQAACSWLQLRLQ